MLEGKWTPELQAKIIARAWKDASFKKRLHENPKDALKEYGVELSDNTRITVFLDDPSHHYFILPQSPTNLNEISDTELENLAASRCHHHTICEKMPSYL